MRPGQPGGAVPAGGAPAQPRPAAPQPPTTQAPKPPPGGGPNAVMPPTMPPGTVSPPSTTAGGAGNAGGSTGVPGDAVMPAVAMEGDVFKFMPQAEPIDLRLLADLVAAQLNIEIMSLDPAMRDKKAQLITQISVPKDRLLDFLSFLLAQNQLVLTRDVAGIYVIQPATEMGGKVGTDVYSPTRIIPTPGIRPSSLQQALGNVTGGAGAAQGGAGAMKLTFLDDLGFILATGTPRQMSILQDLVDALAREQANVNFTRFELRQLSAPIARQRILELLRGRSAGQGPQAAVQQAVDPNAGAVSGPSATLSNLADRLLVDHQGNALVFRGRPDEQELLRRLVSVVDVVNTLQGQWYGIGGAAPIVAEQAQRLGLGQVITLRSQGGQGGVGFGAGQNFNQAQAQGVNIAQGVGAQGNEPSGGSSFILDAEGRGFMYYGTPDQQRRVAQLVQEFEPLLQSEVIVYEFYKLKHSQSEDVAETIRGLIDNQVPTGSSPLLPGGGNRQARNTGVNRLGGDRVNTATANRRTDTGAAAGAAGGAAGDNLAIEAGNETFVLADKANNQIVVKAPRRLQGQFAHLIERLDQRRAQVYIDAQIIVVDNNDGFTLSFEQQLIELGGQTVAMRTLFGSGASGTATNGTITSPATVSPVSPGLVAAIIKSDQVPLIIRAVADTTDGKIIASPKLLVDDNEEAEISAIRQVPTQTQTQTGGTGSGSIVTGFGGFEDAGPKLTVTPRISAGGYLQLNYDIELSNFIGQGSANLPPPRSKTNVKSESVTVPSDSTIVIGGLTLEDVSQTVIKVPLLGDIPLVGQLFRTETQSNQRRTIYIFLTPRILRDNGFSDLKLISEGPKAVAKLKDPLPPARPSLIRTRGTLGAMPTPEPSPERTPEPTPETPATPATAPAAPGRPDPASEPAAEPASEPAER